MGHKTIILVHLKEAIWGLEYELTNGGRGDKKKASKILEDLLDLFEGYADMKNEDDKKIIQHSKALLTIARSGGARL